MVDLTDLLQAPPAPYFLKSPVMSDQDNFHTKCVSRSTLQFWFEIIFVQINIGRFSFEYLLKFSTPCWNLNTYKGKGKAVPLQAWSSPEGSRKLRFPDLMTTAQDSGKVVSLTHRPPLPPGNIPGTHFC